MRISDWSSDVCSSDLRIRAACEASINAYCEALAPDIQATMDRYGAPEGVTAIGLAQHVQSVLQGSFVLAKTTNDPAIARERVKIGRASCRERVCQYV